MMKPRPWPLEAEQEIQNCRVFRVHRDTARDPRDGQAHDFFRLSSSDWVNVIALTEEQEVVLVTQYRHGSRDVTVEIPGGMVDPGETPVDAARRELREETGYDAAEFVFLGVVNPNPALFDNGCHTFLARGAVRVGEVANEGAEETHVVLRALADIPAAMGSGEITHALVIAAFHWLQIYQD